MSGSALNGPVPGSPVPPALRRAGQAVTLRVGHADGAVRLAQLAAGPLRRFAASHAGACPRAVLSLWSQWFLLSLLPPAVATILGDGWELPLAPDQTSVLCAPDGRPEALCLPHAGRPGTGCAASRLLPLRAQLDALGAVLGAAGLPAPVLWGNAAAVLRWAGAKAADDAAGQGADHAVAAGVAALLAMPFWLDGMPNQLAGQLRPRQPSPAPSPQPSAAMALRRCCCLRYRLPGHAPCADCPRGVSPRGSCPCPHRLPTLGPALGPTPGA